MKTDTHFVFGAFATLAVAGALVTGLTMIGSPSEIRMRRLDEQRLDDLNRISASVSEYWQGHGVPPQNLTELQAPAPRLDLRLSDPVTGEGYEYMIKAGSTYELCAVFESASNETEFWSHDRGRKCFAFDAR